MPETAPESPIWAAGTQVRGLPLVPQASEGSWITSVQKLGSDSLSQDEMSHMAAQPAIFHSAQPSIYFECYRKQNFSSFHFLIVCC